MAKKPVQRRAYSYIRFSSAEQEKGDSLRRQAKLRDEVLKCHPEWILDESLIEDFGVSAWEGDNIIDGALGTFILACEAGKVPRGSVLIIEQWDRLSRLPAVEAMELFSRITRRGIEICTAVDGKIHNRESMKDIGNLLKSILTMQLANEESTKKSGRVKEAWDKKRLNDSVITTRCPGWLRWNGEKFELIPERANVIKEIFQMTVKGKGRLAICNEFNKRKESTWGDGNVGGWWPCYISKILRSPAVIGRFQPCRTAKNERGKTIRVPHGEPREAYFPRVIDDALWQRVQEQIAGAQRCNGAMAGAGRPGAFPVRNLFSGLLFDGYHPLSKMVLAGGADVFVSDWVRLHPGSKRVTWQIDQLERLVVGYLRELDYETLAQRDADTTDEETQHAIVQTRLDSINARVDQLVDSLETCGDKPQRQMLLNRLGERAKEKAELEAQIKNLQAARKAAKAATIVLRDARKELCKLLGAKDEETRIRLRAELRRIITRIEVFPRGATDKQVGSEFTNSPGGPCLKIIFPNGQVRWVFGDSNQASSLNPILLDINIPDDEVPGIGDDEKVLDAAKVMRAIARNERIAKPVLGGNSLDGESVAQVKNPLSSQQELGGLDGHSFGRTDIISE